VDNQETSDDTRPRLVLTRPPNSGPAALSETALRFFRALTGRDPTPEEVEEVRERVQRQGRGA
jgi:hypothetical protein